MRLKTGIKRMMTAVVMTAALSFASAGSVFASDLNELLTKVQGLEDYLYELTYSMTELSLKQEYIQTEISAVQDKISENQILIDETQQAADHQYELMGKRIKYLYESGETSYIEALLSADSIGDLLAKFEYIGNIVGYDRQMLQTFIDLSNTLSELQNQLLDRQAELTALQDWSLTNMNEAATLSTASTSDILELGIDQADIDQLVTEYIEEHKDEIRKEIEQSIEQKQEEDPTYNWYEQETTSAENTQSQEQPGSEQAVESPTTVAEQPTVPEIVVEIETTTQAPTEPETEPEPEEDNSGDISDWGYSDAYLIACLCSGEVGYVDYITQWATADLILNRVESGVWPNNVYDVLHQGGQFDAVYWWYIPGTSVPSYLYYIQNGPLDSCLSAAYEAINNRGASHGYMFFCTTWFFEAYPEYFTNTYGEEIGAGSYFYNVY